MNGFETAVIWIAIQISIALVPATFLHLWASRHGPAQGAWVAVASMALVLALSTAAVCPIPRFGTSDRRPTSAVTKPHESTIVGVTASATGAGESSRLDRPDLIRPGIALSNTGLIAWIERIQRTTNRSATQHANIARVFALLILTGAVLGLIRLLVGLWGIRLCRRLGRSVKEPELIELLESLRVEMQCHKSVDLYEVPDLGTAATAGWRRPLILLPEDCRTWDDGERRAVLAHELAHIVRADYAAGLLARLTLALHFYHPLVRWMTGRLLAQQELAADALGARFGGGRDSYLLALSRLALRQNERASFWPARTFLPARGTLIRRIEMLTNMEVNGDRSWSLRNRLLAACLLLAVGAGVLALPRPTRGGDEAVPKVALKETVGIAKPQTTKPTPAIDLSYLPADARGIIVTRPAAICQKEGMDRLVAHLNAEPKSSDLFWLAMMELAVIPIAVDESDRKELRTHCLFRVQDIEQTTSHFKITNGMSQGKKFRAFIPHGYMVRMVRPYEWDKQARIWWPGMAAVRDLRQTYYRYDPHFSYAETMAFYYPDDRTIVVDSEANIRTLINRDRPTSPQWLHGSVKERVEQSLFAMTIDNHDRAMAGIFKAGEDRGALNYSRLFEQVDFWVFGLDDSDKFSLRAFAGWDSTDANRSIVLNDEARKTSISGKSFLVDLVSYTKSNGREPTSEQQKMFAKILEGYEVVLSGSTVNAIPRPSVKLADFLDVVGRDMAERAEVSQERAKAK